MSYNSVGLIDNPDPPAEPIEVEYNDAALLFQNDEQVLERIERLERSRMDDITIDLVLARAEIATLKAELAALTARADKAERVLCAKCKYYNKTGCSTGFGWCENMDRGTHDEFYCASGKRLEVEHGE